MGATVVIGMAVWANNVRGNSRVAPAFGPCLGGREDSDFAILIGGDVCTESTYFRIFGTLYSTHLIMASLKIETEPLWHRGGIVARDVAKRVGYLLW